MFTRSAKSSKMIRVSHFINRKSKSSEASQPNQHPNKKASTMVQNATRPKVAHSSNHGMIIIANCPNITQLVSQYMENIDHNNKTSNQTDGSTAFDDSQKDAVVYIVVVLFFYSFCIGFMMIRYMQKEAKEQQECKKYRRYINMAQDQYLASMSRARLANRLALQALNTVNAIPQTTNYGSKVTFV